MKSKWNIAGHEERLADISRELGRLLTEQTEFFRKGTQHTAEELREYEASHGRVREMFAELERLRKRRKDEQPDEYSTAS